MSQEQIQDLEYKISELKSDPLLKDVPKTFTLEELDTLIALEQGRAYHIVIDRSPLASICLYILYIYIHH
jgi:U11/U12 small nuclear ribonucleoprotein SNRNP25